MLGCAVLRELTLRGILLGGLITLLFTAANVYLGLKVGITFATSIPAAVISMAVLRFVRGSTILENNIVQTIASAAGTLAAIIFVLPGLVMIGWWQGFPYWTTVAVCAIGGTLGVMFSVPLRRALVTGSDLPYPEGVAAAEVLKVGSGSVGGAEENAKGLAAIVAGSLASAGFALLAAMKLAAGELATAFRLGGSGGERRVDQPVDGADRRRPSGRHDRRHRHADRHADLLGGAGPVLTSMQGVGADVAATVNEVFRNQVRFIGAGTIGVAAVWTLLKIIGPIVAGIRSAMAASAARAGGEVLELTERDLPIGIVGGTILASLVPDRRPAVVVLRRRPDRRRRAARDRRDARLHAGDRRDHRRGLRLHGRPDRRVEQPGLGRRHSRRARRGRAARRCSTERSPDNAQALTAYALFTTAIVFSIATISNDNLQDLKTGQLVGATPWKQQVALVIGVIFGSLVIGPVLDILNTSFGFQGMPGAGRTRWPRRRRR